MGGVRPHPGTAVSLTGHIDHVHFIGQVKIVKGMGSEISLIGDIGHGIGGTGIIFFIAEAVGLLVFHRGIPAGLILKIQFVKADVCLGADV